jgi:hypothetical protein
MRKMLTVMGVVLSTVAVAGPSPGGAGGDPREVSKEQFETLIQQCRYSATPEDCRADVQKTYRVGRADPELDCRSYSGVSVCGDLTLTPQERQCVITAVRGGLDPRRAEVECYAFY